jgi:CRP-like cAMP-binding protein
MPILEAYAKYAKVLCHNNFMSESTAEKLLTLGEIRQLKRKDFLVKEGSREREVSIVLDGLMRIYFVDGEREVNIFILPELALATDFETYLYGKPGTQYIQCIEDTTVLVLKHEIIQKLLKEDSHFAADLHELMLEQLAASLYRIKTFLLLNAKDRLLALTAQRPELLQRVPLNILASFIGTTKEHVSRIRGELTPRKGKS